MARQSFFARFDSFLRSLQPPEAPAPRKRNKRLPEIPETAKHEDETTPKEIKFSEGTEGTFDARSLRASELFEAVEIHAHVSQYGD